MGQEQEGNGDEGDEEGEEEGDGPDEENSPGGSFVAEARVHEETEDQESQMGSGGLGSTARQFELASMLSQRGIGSGQTGPSLGQGSRQTDTLAPDPAISSFPSRRGIGSKQLGLGFGTHSNETSYPIATDSGLRHPQRSFVRDGTGSGTPGSSTPKLSQEEKIHFSKLQGSLGAKLMAKMGWQTVSLFLQILLSSDIKPGHWSGSFWRRYRNPCGNQTSSESFYGLGIPGFQRENCPIEG